jgi:hypothetical protein
MQDWMRGFRQKRTQNRIKELKAEKLFPRKGAKAQRNPLETRQRFAPLRLCAKKYPAYRTFRAKLVKVLEP